MKKKLERFLPIPRIVKKNDKYHFNYEYQESIGKIKAFYGNFSVLLKAYIYILLMGNNGLKETSEIAVLNSKTTQQAELQTFQATAQAASLIGRTVDAIVVNPITGEAVPLSGTVSRVELGTTPPKLTVEGFEVEFSDVVSVY